MRGVRFPDTGLLVGRSLYLNVITSFQSMESDREPEPTLIVKIELVDRPRSREYNSTQVTTVQQRGPIMHFHTLVDEVRDLSLAEKQDMRILLERFVAEERREEMARSHEESIEELRQGRLEFTSNPAIMTPSTEDTGQT
ncbi:MAG: hypothetical protein GY856_16640 [bacterium]|nr:hypothetical protein [bacterium]